MIRVQTESGAHYLFDNSFELACREQGESPTSFPNRDESWNRVANMDDIAIGKGLYVFFTDGRVLVSTPVVCVCKES